MRIFDGEKWIKVSNVPYRRRKFQEFVSFVNGKIDKYEPMTASNLAERYDCPVRDQETVGKYLDAIQKLKLSGVKSIFASGKVYFKGCTPTEEEMIKRVGFEGWVGVKVSEFLRNHPLIGRGPLERIYRFLEYREPLFPIVATLMLRNIEMP